MNLSFWEASGRRLYLYTKGKEFSLEGVEYKGYYHLKYGVPYSNFMPTSTSKKLYPYRFNESNTIYDKIKPEYLKLDTYIEPYQAPLYLTAQQYKAGSIIRYFLKKRNENLILEINKDLMAKLGKEGGIDDIMYQLVSMDWKISSNGITNELVRFNTISLNSAEAQMPGIKNKVRSVYEYSIVDITP